VNKAAEKNANWRQKESKGSLRSRVRS
jgi:hypothetical protein